LGQTKKGNMVGSQVGIAAIRRNFSGLVPSPRRWEDYNGMFFCQLIQKAQKTTITQQQDIIIHPKSDT